MTASESKRRYRVLELVSMVAVACIVLAVPAGAVGDGSGPTDHDGWSIVEPAAVGLNAPRLSLARDYAFVPTRHTQGMVVVRAGHLAAEWYAPGSGPRSWAASWSMAKSVTSILIGIAIDEGKIASVDASMSTWIPEWRGTPKAAITLEDVLQMTTGLQGNEDLDPAHAATSTLIGLGRSRDELAYAENRPLVAPPGTRFQYSSADAMLLSRVLEVATGMSPATYARQKLFGPLGISQLEWWQDDAGHTLTYCCIDSTTRNFARIGQLYLNNGRWNGHQIVSAAWVRASLTGSSASKGGYGYQWWISHFKGVPGTVYFMNGLDNQEVYLIPSEHLVVARSGTYVKSSCPAVADPNLFGRYPPGGVVPNAGTTPPDSWDHGAFLALVAASVRLPAGTSATPGPEQPMSTRDAESQRLAPCPNPAALHSALAESPTARPMQGQPTFTG